MRAGTEDNETIDIQSPESAKMLHATSTGSLTAQNERLREIIHDSLVVLMNYEDRPNSQVVRDAIAKLRRA